MSLASKHAKSLKRAHGVGGQYQTKLHIGSVATYASKKEEPGLPDAQALLCRLLSMFSSEWRQWCADYTTRRKGGQEENVRRRTNAHQYPVKAQIARDDGGGALRSRSNKGTNWANKTRRRGRPAHKRSPNDSPLRDGNRDRVIGLLTMRAAKTLEYYFSETNLTYNQWLAEYIRRNPIPTTGSWDAISGEEFLRKLLTGGLTTATWKGGVSDPLFAHVGTLGVDPRSLGQRIMDIRTALAAEFVQDLQNIAEENAVLMRECAMASLESLPQEGGDDGPLPTMHPEMLAESPRSIPDTAKDFIFYANETPEERYHRERDRELAEGSGAPSAGEEPEHRPGLDDINEFESELEAGPKWQRRFRIMNEQKESSAPDQTDNPDTPDSSGDAGNADEGKST